MSNVVITVLTSHFPKDPLIVNPHWRYLMFTDDKSVTSNFWEVHYMDYPEQVKSRPYNYVNYTNLVYVDGSVLYTGDPDEILTMMSGAAMFTGNDKLWAVSTKGDSVCHYTQNYFNKVCVQFGKFPDGEKIKYCTPYALDGNLGKSYNEEFEETFCEYVVIMDGDGMFLDNEWGRKISKLIEDNDGDIYGCMTNRLMDMHQLYEGIRSDDDSIIHHKEISDKLWREHGTKTKDADYVAGLFMLIRKSVWNEVKFKNGLIFLDIDFCRRAREKGFKVKVALGIYMFHYYRMGKEVERIPHLLRFL